MAAATEPEDIEGLAGEYVLGTLDATERRAAEARVRTDASFRMAVAAWEKRLQPIADAEAPIAPPPDLLERIESRLRPPVSAGPPTGQIEALRRSLRRWRAGAALMAAAAAALIVVIVWDQADRRQQEYVAVLTAGGGSPAFVATVDLHAGTLVLRKVGGEAAPPDRSYQLWAIAPDSGPRSLGIIEQAQLVSAVPTAGVGALTLAVSVEPKGGSPTGLPTGPVVYSGKLVAPDNESR